MRQRQLLILRTFWMCLLTFMVLNVSFGQIKISGTVTDIEDKSGLIGVSIVVKGTTTGTTTDFDGNYALEVPDENAVLDFSYTGYTGQSVTVGGQKVIDIVLSAANTVLDEVVVVGYTTRKRGELTGSVSTINAEEIERTTNKDVAKSLAGKVPGLIVSDRGGVPGSTQDVSILIRGKSTLGNNSPLILIDNIPAASFSHLSPSDIASLSVLKDGAAAIYGARAANGVILITTKRGSKGKPTINFSSTYSLSTFSAFPELMSSEQYAIYENEIADRNQTPVPFTEDQIAQYASGADPIKFPSTNWADETFADFSPEWRNTLSISGGNESVQYFVSGDHIDQVGLYKSGALSFQQYQLRSNIDIQMFKNLKVGVDLSGRFGKRDRPGIDDGFIYKHIYTNEPTELAFFPDGSPAFGGENGANPAVMSSNESGFREQIDNNLRTRLSFDLSLDELTEGLSVRGFTGIRRWTADTKTWYTPWTYFTQLEGSEELIPAPGFSQAGPENILTERFWKFDELMLNATIHYEKSFNRHSFQTFIGTERFTSEQREFEAQRRGFPSDDHPELFAGSDEGQTSSGISSESARLNYFGSISYDFAKRYFVDLTLRHDGSSNFGPGNRFGTFPGVAVGWSIGNEAFMKDVGFLDALKLRASWAIMGNDRVGPFQFLTRYNFGLDLNRNNPLQDPRPNYYVFGSPGVRFNGYASANVPNPDITWETADMKNLGLSFSMFNYKLTGDVNYFYQKRRDILARRTASIPNFAGLQLPNENLGKVDNFGWEVQLGWADRIGKNIGYNFGFNFTDARNRVVFLDEAEDVIPGLQREGKPLDSYIVFPTNGIFENQEQIDATEVVRNGTVPGEPIYLDTNGDGELNNDDRVRIFSSNVPEIQYGFTAGFSYKNFDVNLLFQGQAKAKMLVFFDQGGAKPEFVFNNRWTADNPTADYPRAFAQGDAFSGIQIDGAGGGLGAIQTADLYLMDASFVRLKEIELGYSFTKKQLKFGDVRVYFRGLNLLTMFSDIYDLGLDPEATRYNNFRDATIPSLKSYSFGVNLKF